MNIIDSIYFVLALFEALSTSYAWQQEVILDDGGLITLYWTVDVKKNVLLFEIQARTLGYIGFGVSPDGTMASADIMVGYIDSEGEAQITDYWALKNGGLEYEDSQDWKLLAGRQNDTYTMLRVRRSLRPLDQQFDAIIYNLPTWIIWAYHPDIPERGKMPVYHGKARRGAKQLCVIEPNCFSTTQWPKNAAPSLVVTRTLLLSTLSILAISPFLFRGWKVLARRIDRTSNLLIVFG